ncbi:MAG: GTP-binding protein [Roseburia sp.]|nr:GTP-binding protein [Roseburia sp.]
MTKIDIISGFLGAGKTTFIKKMIEEVFQGEKIVLIENEFGEVGIDGGFLKDAGIEITEMNSGCICCSLVGDFGKNLHEVINKFHPDRILIEPSGVGKLSDVMKSVIDVEKEEDVKLNGLITVVNALKASKQMKAFGEFFNNQIEYATTVVLSRSQKATPEQLELCVKQIQALNPKAAIITTPWDAIRGEQILKVVEGQDSLEMKLLAEEHAKAEAEAHEHEHHHDHDHECHEHEHHHEHDENCTCGCHDHEHHHDHEDHECHEHHHDHEEHECHEHHHDHEDHECHEHHHDHEDHECHNHHHDHEEHECHEHDHDHEGHEHHHEHDENCTCGCHDHEHHHHHHADEVFTSWGRETPHKFTREKIEEVLKIFCDTEDYGTILRAKGMVESVDGTWIYFDMVPGEYELRQGEPDYTGRLCVIGTDMDEHRLEELFEIA